MSDAPDPQEPARSFSAREMRIAAGLLVLGALLRVLLAGLGTRPIVEDSQDYHQLGVALAEGRGFTRPGGEPEGFRPPLYPTMIALVYGIAGTGACRIYGAQILLDLGTCALLGFWACRRLGSRASLTTIGLGAVSITGIGASTLIATECLATFLIAAIIVSFDLARESPRRSWWILGVGLLSGALTLTRSNMVFLAALLAAFLLIERRPFWKRLGGVALLGVGNLLVVTPWLLRNDQVFGAPVLSTQAGFVLYLAQKTPGGSWVEDEPMKRALQMPQLDGSRYLLGEARKGMSIGKTLRTYPIKLIYLFDPIDREFIRLGKRTWNVTYILSMVLACLAIPVLWKRNRAFLVLGLLPMAYISFMTLLFPSIPRFRLPTEAVVLPLAAFGAIMVLERMRKLKGDGTRTAGESSLSPPASH